MKWILFGLLASSTCAFAQSSTTTTEAISITAPAAEVTEVTPEATPAPEATLVVSAPKLKKEKPAFEHKAYGYFSFSRRETFKTIQNLEPIERNEIDFAEVAFEGEYHLTPTSKIEFEVEFEHGGVGTTIEFDPFEEFGEFEQEIEQGGEVAVPELFYKKTFTSTDSAVKVGRFPLFISLGSVLTKPHKYPTILASDLEIRMIPLNWTETGIQFEQKFHEYTFRAATVSGLNSEFFRSYNWVGGGHQLKLEKSNSDDLAVLASFELGSISKGHGLAFSYYTGNTTSNRYKVDKLKDEANVTIWSAMLNWKFGRFGVSGEYIQGELQNSEKVVAANSTLGGLAKPKAFAPLGKTAVLQSGTVSYDLTDDFVIYVKAEHVDTFAAVDGNIAKNPRYDVSRRSGGFMWTWDTAMFLKAQYAREHTELTGLPETYQASLAVGFDLDTFNN